MARHRQLSSNCLSYLVHTARGHSPCKAVGAALEVGVVMAALEAELATVARGLAAVAATAAAAMGKAATGEVVVAARAAVAARAG